MRKLFATAGVVTWAGILILPPIVAAGGNSTNAHLCQRDGYQSLFTSDGEPFKNVGDCVSYAAQGGIFLLPGADLSITADDPTADPLAVRVRNDGPLDTSATVRFTSLGPGVQEGPFTQFGLPIGWDCVYTLGSGDTNWHADCSSDSIAAGTEAVFTPRLHRGWEIEVTAAGEPDPDSTPDNQDPDEDDYLLLPEPF